MYTLRIKITKDLLEESKDCQSLSESCVFARAFRDFFPLARVYNTCIYPFGRSYTSYLKIEYLISFETTKEISDYIEEFDNCSYEDIPSLPEKEFELPIPDWVIDRINIDEIKPLLINHKNLELICQTH